MSLDSPGLRPRVGGLYPYWCAIRPSAGLPPRRDFAPAAIPDLLPNLKLVEVHRAPLRLRYRLVGTGIDAALGRNVVAQWLDRIHADHPNWPGLLGDYRAVIDTGAPLWRHGPPPVVSEPDCTSV